MIEIFVSLKGHEMSRANDLARGSRESSKHPVFPALGIVDALYALCIHALFAFENICAFPLLSREGSEIFWNLIIVRGLRRAEMKLISRSSQDI